jgi:signal transduction histidine kinase
VKLFTERYLGGRVSFGTTPGGTTFWVELPAKPA